MQRDELSVIGIKIEGSFTVPLRSSLVIWLKWVPLGMPLGMQLGLPLGMPFMGLLRLPFGVPLRGLHGSCDANVCCKLDESSL